MGRVLPLSFLVSLLLVVVVSSSWASTLETDQAREPTLDPVVAEDGAACFEAMQGVEGAHCVVLYAHLRGGVSAQAMNVQYPPAEAEDLALGPDEVDAGPAPDGVGRMVLWPVPQWIDYGNPDQQLRAGMNASMQLVPEAPIMGHWALSVPEPSQTTCLTVMMTLRTGYDREGGEVVAEGASTYTVAGTDALAVPQEVPGTCPSSQAIVPPGEAVPVVVDLGSSNASIPSWPAFHVEVEWSVTPVVDPDVGSVEPVSGWVLHTGGQHRPRIVLGIEDAGYVSWGMGSSSRGIERISPRVTSPWGGWEFRDPERLELTIRDKDGDLVEPAHLEGPDMSQEYAPRWVWSWQEETPTPEPPFTFIVQAENLQGTEIVTGEHYHEPVAMSSGFALPAATGLALLGFAVFLAVIITGAVLLVLFIMNRAKAS